MSGMLTSAIVFALFQMSLAADCVDNSCAADETSFLQQTHILQKGSQGAAAKLQMENDDLTLRQPELEETSSIQVETAVARGQGRRSRVDANTTQPDEDCDCPGGWSANCICESDQECKWEGPCHFSAEQGPADERVPMDAVYESSDKTGPPSTHVVVVDRFPIVSQNSFASSKGCIAKETSKGSHACWAVTRASAAYFANVIPAKPVKFGPKGYAEHLYNEGKCQTGWVVPTQPTSTRPTTAEVMMNARLKPLHFKKGEDAEAIYNKFKSLVQNDQAVSVAMSQSGVCSGTFHYVTVFGVAKSADGKNELLVSDPWCTGPSDEGAAYQGAAFQTSSKAPHLAPLSTGATPAYTLETHPCIKKAIIEDVGERKPTTEEAAGNIASSTPRLTCPAGNPTCIRGPKISGLEYADGANCMFKMWVVTKMADKKPGGRAKPVFTR